jgi:hypothetical protein
VRPTHAVEQIAGCQPPPVAGLVRVLHAELERIANHLDVAARLADAAGLAVATARFEAGQQVTHPAGMVVELPAVGAVARGQVCCPPGAVVGAGGVPRTGGPGRRM